MARFSVAFTKAATGTNTLIAQLRTSASRDVRVWEIGVFSTTAVLTDVGVARATAVGSGFTSVTPQADDFSTGAATVLLDTAATGAPTNSAAYLRRAVLPATAGSGVVWTFPAAITVPISAGLLLWNAGTGTSAALAGYVTYDE